MQNDGHDKIKIPTHLKQAKIRCSKMNKKWNGFFLFWSHIYNGSAHTQEVITMFLEIGSINIALHYLSNLIIHSTSKKNEKNLRKTLLQSILVNQSFIDSPFSAWNELVDKKTSTVFFIHLLICEHFLDFFFHSFWTCEENYENWMK